MASFKSNISCYFRLCIIITRRAFVSHSDIMEFVAVKLATAGVCIRAKVSRLSVSCALVLSKLALTLSRWALIYLSNYIRSTESETKVLRTSAPL